MSVKYIKLNADGTFSPHQLDKFEDLLNPIKNNVWFKHSGAGMMKVGQIKPILSALYTHQNIKDNYKFFCPQFEFCHTQYGHPTVSYENMIAWLPEEVLWMLPFINYSLARGSTVVGINYNKLYQAVEGSSNTLVGFATDASNGSSYALPFSDEDKAKILKVFKAAAKHWDTIFSDHAAKRYSPDYYLFTMPGPAHHLMGMAQGRAYITDQTGDNSWNAEKLFTDINRGRLSENISISCNGIRNGNTPRILFKVTAQNRGPIERVLNYSTNVLDLLDYPILAKNEHKPVLYGVELEVSTNYPPVNLVNATDIPFLICKQDGSVSGSKAYPIELVTAPASYKAHKIQWAKFFNKLSYDNFDCTKNTNNGMHVHIGTESFNGNAHIRRMTFFINNPANFDFFFKVSERTKANIDSFCRYFDPVKNRGNTMSKAVDLAKRHRGAVNFGKGTTVEVRIFKGIVSYANIIKNLEVVDSIFHFTRDCSLADMSLGAYIKWINATPINRYMVLKKYLSTFTTLDKMIKASEVMDIVFLEREPKKMLNLIEKKNYKMDNDHLTALNKMKGVRTFILDKDSGAVSLAQPTGIDALNTELTSRYASL